MRIGVLAAQGAFAEHIKVLNQLEVDTTPVRLPRELAGMDGLIIPGGESTTISRLIAEYGLEEEIKKLAVEGKPLFGTCAGMIILSRNITGNTTRTLCLMGIQVKRNAFGRQRESFEVMLPVPVLGEEHFPAVFIRAPLIENYDNDVEVLAKLPDNTVVAARQGNLLVTAFHPELTGDQRFHRYFLDMVAGTR
jgi:5'-phosphate synthase pdxT subunit